MLLDNNRDVWRKRLHLLEHGEKKLMEEYVALKLKERSLSTLSFSSLSISFHLISFIR
jgi:hypothetical protein